MNEVSEQRTWNWVESLIFCEVEVPALSITALAQSLNKESSDEANSLKS